ncbi:MAG: hypothetical protein ACRD2X_14380 [Vicinamibacteraceae bacterium]
MASTIIAGAALGSLVASTMGARAAVGLFLVLAIGASSVRRIVVRRG